METRSTGNNLRHGLSHTRTHNIWVGMRQRCGNPTAEAFEHYGGRGIKVCERWQSSFEAFVEDMGLCPPAMSIERIDNDKGYSPDNCRWACSTDQVRNRRTSIYYEHAGETRTLLEWSQRIGVPYKTLHHRYTIGKRGGSLMAPLRKTAKGESRKNHR